MTKKSILGHNVQLRYKDTLWRLLRYTLPFKVMLSLIVGGTILVSVAQLASLYMIKPLTDTVFAPTIPLTDAERMHTLSLLALLLGGLTLFKLLLEHIVEFQKKLLVEKVGANIRDDLFRHFHRLPMSFYHQHQSGELQALATYNIQSIQSFLVYQLTNILLSVVTFLGVGIVLTRLNFRLMILLLAPLPITALFSFIAGKRTKVGMHKVYQKFGRMTSNIYNNIVGAAVVKTNTAEAFEYEKLSKSNVDVWKSWLEVGKVRLLFGPLVGFFYFLSAIGVKWFGGRDIIGGSMSLGELMVFVGYSTQFYGPARALTWTYERFQGVAAAAAGLFDILDHKDEFEGGVRSDALMDIRGEVRFENVHFGYEPGTPVLHGITFDIKPGETIGITGPSGAGKTTLVSLLTHLFEPSEGAIYIDGTKVDDVDVRDLRSHIGLVLQDTLLFRGTIADNISYAHPAPRPEQIIAAAKAAGAHPFISRLPDAYDTVIGEKGSGLSGGEKQRISIARTLLRNPRIIVFDEATSSLDSATELFIQDRIKELGGEHTIFAITHRISMLSHVDKLMVIDKGRICAMGPYEEVIASDVFKELTRKKEVA